MSVRSSPCHTPRYRSPNYHSPLTTHQPMPDALFVVNAGSSSLKFSAFAADADELPLLARGQVDGLSLPGAQQARQPKFTACDAQGQVLGQRQWEAAALTHAGAMEFLLGWGAESGPLRGRRVAAAGHRVVHGGVRF